MSTQNKQEENLTTLTYQEAETMVKTYHAYAKLNPDYAENPHVKCVWFPASQIINMCRKMEENEADGLRVYFGRYPSDVSGFDEPKPLPNTNTIFFMSTKSDAIGGPQNDCPDCDIENRGISCPPICEGDTIDDTTP